MFASEWQELLKPATRERQKRKTKDSVPATVPEQETRDAAAEKFDIGGRTVSKAANVLKKGCEQLQQAARDGRVSGTITLLGDLG